MAKVRVIFKNGIRETFNVKDFTVNKVGGRVSGFTWTHGRDRILTLDPDEVVSVYERAAWWKFWKR